MFFAHHKHNGQFKVKGYAYTLPKKAESGKLHNHKKFICNINYSSGYFMILRLFKASKLFSSTHPTILQLSISGQLPQVLKPFFVTHFRISHILPQYGVFTPAARQPMQLIISAVICTWFISLQRFAVFFRKVLSLLTVAMRASHLSQSSPQQAISSFISSSLHFFQ